MKFHRPPLPRWFYLLRYHRLSQFYWRVVSRIRQWLLRKRRGGRFAALPEQPPALRSGTTRAAWASRRLENCRTAGRVERVAALLAGRFSFLHEEHTLGIPVDWRVSQEPDLDLLWKFHLHYHEFLVDVVAEACLTGRRDLSTSAWQIVVDWIEKNPVTSASALRDAWHPFCISRRIPVWILLWELAPPGLELAPQILESVCRQAYVLAGNLERDVGGNHLLENARGLAMAGSFFDGSDANHWLSISRKIIAAELPRQILPHGEHFERSPMYHAQMLDVLLDIADMVVVLDPAWAELCRRESSRMAEFLNGILHPDGEFPLLGDSVFDESPPSRNLICQAGVSAKNGNGARRVGDYWAWRDESSFVLFDGGPVGADHLPAHAHSDLLTIEASVGGQRLIVDTGVFGYRDDASRHFCRSTAAHNVLQVDDAEQCDTWSRFRMGYRGHPRSWVSGRTGDFEWVGATHDAYRRRGLPQVGRWLACRPKGPWFVLDWSSGTGPHKLCSRLRFAPEVAIEQISESELRIRVGENNLLMGTLDSEVIKIEKSAYFPQFGVRNEVQVAVCCRTMKLPVAIGWWVLPEDGARPQKISEITLEKAIGAVLQADGMGDFDRFCRIAAGVLGNL